MNPYLPSQGQLVAGKYRIERLLGQGGMGAVFAARHEVLHQRVALKVLAADPSVQAEAVTRFLNEARAAAGIQGEHIARVLDVGQLENGLPFMVLEYLEGLDFADLLHQRGVLAIADAVDFVLQALQAIAQAHTAGIVHRDLKPANLFLARQHDGTDIVKILDFGISKAINPDIPSAARTSTKALLGTPSYMSPEQLRSSRSVDARSDIWAIGVVLYELLTGRLPFNGEVMTELFVAILEHVPTPVTAWRPEVPAGLEQVIARCLERDVSQRFGSVVELAMALAPFGSTEAYLLAERVRRSMPSAPPGRAVAVTPTALAPPTAQSASPWSHATASPPPKGRALGAIFGITALILVPASVLGVRALVMHRAHDAAPTTSTTGEHTATASAPRAADESMHPIPPVDPKANAPDTAPNRDPNSGSAPPPIASSAAALVGVPGASSARSQAAPAPASTSRGRSGGSRPQGTASQSGSAPAASSSSPASPASPSGAAKPDCTPNYVLDANGEKHFKPECFR